MSLGLEAMAVATRAPSEMRCTCRALFMKEHATTTLWRGRTAMPTQSLNEPADQRTENVSGFTATSLLRRPCLSPINSVPDSASKAVTVAPVDRPSPATSTALRSDPDDENTRMAGVPSSARKSTPSGLLQGRVLNPRKPSTVKGAERPPITQISTGNPGAMPSKAPATRIPSMCKQAPMGVRSETLSETVTESLSGSATTVGLSASTPASDSTLANMRRRRANLSTAPGSRTAGSSRA